jgi:hypothetical protein
MDYMPFIAYIISVVSLALSAYTLYELNCTKNKTPQKPSKRQSPATKSSSKTTPYKW